MMSETLSRAINEKDVENTYRHSFLTKFKDMEITSPFGCDGFGVSKSAKIRVLMEFKDNVNLSNKSDLVKVLAQSVFYVKRFYDKGLIPPSTVFIGDRNECVALHVNDLVKYLDMDIDWKVAPSSAHTITDLVLAMIKDENIKPFVFDVKDFTGCVDKVKDLTQNVQRKVVVTDKNITEVFRHFDEKVLGKSTLTTNEKANLFVQILVNKDENYLVGSSRMKKVHTKSFGQVSITSRESYTSFFDHFASSYSPSQKHKLVAIVDRIIEDTTRRKQGEFFTPTIWVDKAHEYIASVYGENWKEEYVVWDPAWGTGNLTRDYQFKELYVSTLNQSDIDTANQMGYNPEAVKFASDFLNDDYSKLPEGLRKAIEEGRKIIVLMNPPYGTVNDFQNIKQDGGKSKNSIEDTIVKKQMNDEKLGLCVKNLYSQFIYKLSKMGKINICVFSPPLMYSGIDFKIFREKVLNQYEFKSGFIMNSAHFADVSSWGLTFSVLDKK
jgi:hypothetical protein